MGQILEAKCKCGYNHDEIFFGGVKSNYKTVCNVPGINIETGQLEVVNLYDHQRAIINKPKPQKSKAITRMHNSKIVEKWYLFYFAPIENMIQFASSLNVGNIVDDRLDFQVVVVDGFQHGFRVRAFNRIL